MLFFPKWSIALGLAQFALSCSAKKSSPNAQQHAGSLDGSARDEMSATPTDGSADRSQIRYADFGSADAPRYAPDAALILADAEPPADDVNRERDRTPDAGPPMPFDAGTNDATRELDAQRTCVSRCPEGGDCCYCDSTDYGPARKRCIPMLLCHWYGDDVEGACVSRTETTEQSCSDGVDNDSSGALDCGDTSCGPSLHCGGPGW